MMVSYKEHLDINCLDEDEEEEELSEDEVFAHGRTENGISKPLMAPRHKVIKTESFQTRVRRAPPLRVLWGPLAYGLVALASIVGIICLIVFLFNMFVGRSNPQILEPSIRERKLYKPCSNITVSEVWSHTFPMLTTETAFRLADLNKDGTLDFILGFGTGADAYIYPPVVCDVYFQGSPSGCGGGLLALDGKSGLEMWRTYTMHELFALNCRLDIDQDGITDCIAGGRMAELVAVSGKNGKVIWRFNDALAKIETSNVYTPAIVKDLDDDGMADLVIVHGGDPLKKPGSATRLIGRLLIVSSKSGQVLQWSDVPDKKESYYSPQIHTHPDGTELVLFGTGGETHGGSLWVILLSDLYKGQMDKARAIYTDDFKGVMTPPAMVDLTGDDVPEIVMAMFNSTVRAYDGLSFGLLWSHNIPGSETYSTPGVGYFNNDSIPDFIINYQTGPGFPIYYYTQTTILDGATGKPLLDKPVVSVVGTQASPLTVGLEGFGNDIFLYWTADCHGEGGQKDLPFTFIKGSSVHEQSRADFCKLRFKEKLYTRQYALSSSLQQPGIIIYDSDTKKDLEYSSTLNYTLIGMTYLRSHPQYWQETTKGRYYHPPEDEYSDTDSPPPDYYWYRDSPRGRHRYMDNRRKQLPPLIPDWEQPMNRRKRRHVGPHDGGGIQRTISTGTLAPSIGSISNDDPTSTIDVVFATFWFYPAHTQALLPEDQACIKQEIEKEAQRFQTDNQYYGMDHDAYEEAITMECLKRNGHAEEGSIGSQKEYNPFNRPMGQMTVYRQRLTCECKTHNCAHILPFSQQSWSSYMGKDGNSFFKARH